MNMPINAKSTFRTPLAAHLPVLKVVGIGGGGCNAVNRMIELGMSGVDYVACNTDSQALKSSLATTRVQLGPRLTRGLGAGGDPKIGEAAAEESFSDLNRAMAGADMVFLAGGMGGGTGTGAISVAARVARNLGAVTVAIVTMPFSFEVGRRQQNARNGLAQLREHTDTLISVPNDRLLQIAPRDLPLELSFRLADDVLRQGIQGISELITQTGMINVDFAHVRQLMQMGGGSLLAIGQGQGQDKALQAVERALHHPLIESVSLENATGIIANFTAGQSLTFVELAEALTFLQQKTNNRAEIIPGVITDEGMGDRAQVILVITGLGATAVETRAANSRPQPALQPVSEQAISGSTGSHRPHFEPQPAQAPGSRSQPQPVAPVEMVNPGLPDLDIPAFMRRRFIRKSEGAWTANS